MEMSLDSVSGQTRVVRRRAFTKWVNWHLTNRSLCIEDLIDLADCFVTIKLLEILSKRNIPIIYSGHQPVRLKQKDVWRSILEFLKNEDFPSDINEKDLDTLSRGSVDALLAFVWCLIKLYLIEPCKKAMLGKTQNSARKFILSWVRQKLPHRTINNFDEDWKDGIAICELVNSLQPGAIPEKLFSDKRNCEGNVKLGIQVAYDKFGIPQIISPFDVATSHIDELSILTYIALFCKYESLTKGDTQNKKASPSKENSACKAYGSGLKSGELGKVADFIVELHGAKASDITIAIECKPTDGGYDEKPELSVKTVGKSTYVVKYIPKKPGEYIISVLHCGAHILRSPFHLSVTGHTGYNGVLSEKSPALRKDKTGSMESIPGFRETLRDTDLPVFKSMKEAPTQDVNISNGINDTNKAQSSNSSTPSIQVHDIPLGIPMNTGEGPGLVAGEVGRVGKFTVITDNNTKGPLSVCISCPAVSIPVPYVKSEKKNTHTEHRVLYIPTEPGTYEIYIKWGENGIRGSPFKVFINDVNVDDVDPSRESGGSDLDDIGGKGKIRVYYAATSMKSKARRDKQLLEMFLDEKKISTRPDFDSWIALDVGMSRTEREKVFKKAGHRSTPVLFVNDRYIGTYEDVVIMDKEGLFDSCLDY